MVTFFLPSLLCIKNVFNRRMMLIVVLLLMPSVCSARIVINEVMWMGTDLSTADEWLELYNPDQTSVDLSGHTITSLKSTGADGVIFTFPSGSIIGPEEYIVIANKAETDSRLAITPFAVTTSISLPNSKLLIKLFDQYSVLIDSLDDGVGNPFAGLNVSGGVKASMERIDPLASGADSSNWASATTVINVDADASVLATPGARNSVAVASLTPTLSQKGEGESSSASSLTALTSTYVVPTSVDRPTPSPQGEGESLSLSSFASSSCSLPNISMIIQDGELTGIDKTTVNFQAVAVTGSIADISCHWAFTDGYTSDSCNPPPHSFTQIGTTIVALEAKNSCGTSILTKEIVLSSSKQASLSLESQGTLTTYPSPFAKLFLASALPNPESVDGGKELVILLNRGEETAHLSGWKLRIGHTTVSTFALTGDLAPREQRIIFSSEMKIALPNSIGHVTLVSPYDDEVSTIAWEKAEEGRRYFPVDCRDAEVTGIVTAILDDGTLLFQPDLAVQRYFTEPEVPLKMIGAVFLEELSDVQESLRALLKDQKVELQFDTELWSKEGKLQAYLSSSTMKDSVKEWIGIGLLEAEKKKEYKRKEEYLLAESDARTHRRGMWQESNEKGVLEEEVLPLAPRAESTDQNVKTQKIAKTVQKTAKKAKKSKVSQKQAYYTAMYKKDLLAEQEMQSLNLDRESVPLKAENGASAVLLSLLAGMAGSFVSRKFF
jgi:hypothetical protein